MTDSTRGGLSQFFYQSCFLSGYFHKNKLGKLGDAIAISKSETTQCIAMTDPLADREILSHLKKWTMSGAQI